ncbi:MAG TPA: VOC family protein [Acidimicrobiia bacterium]|nr:VOC family protein [Acidimicrobiia bacterium]
MTTPRVTSVMVDCRDLDAMIAFWTGLLDVGVRNRNGQFAWLERQPEGGWSLAFQQVPDPTPGKNKLHLDGHCSDLESLSDKVTSLGGRLVERHRSEGFEWWVFSDVEDNVFCFGRSA